MGRITIERRTMPEEGFKYRVDIAFSVKPDYSEVEQDIKKRWGADTEPDTKMIWEHILLEAEHSKEAVPELWKVIEPVTDKITDIVLIATSNLYGYVWHRVKLFVLSDEDIEIDELNNDLDEVVTQYFGSGNANTGHIRFLEVTKISKFPGEGRLISRTDVPLTMKMIKDSADRLEKKKAAEKQPK